MSSYTAGMKLFSTLFAALAAFAAVTAAATNSTQPAVAPNGCVTFSVSAGTGCAWMCGFCASSLGTNNYYFTTDVCTYQQGTGCVGNPLAGVPYTCCTTEEEGELEAEDIFDDCDDCDSEGYDDDDSCDDDEDVTATDVDTYDTEIVIIKIRRRNA